MLAGLAGTMEEGTKEDRYEAFGRMLGTQQALAKRNGWLLPG